MKTKFIGFILILLPVCASAQKNRPVASDCVTLFEVLRTDYSQIEDPEQRKNRITGDRKRILAILKGYLPATYTRPPQRSITSAMDSLNALRGELSAIEQERQRVNGMEGKTLAEQIANARATGFKNKRELDAAYAAKLKDIQTKEYRIFVLEWQAVAAAYSSNAYMSSVLPEFQQKFYGVEVNSQDTKALGASGAGTLQFKSGPLIGSGALTFTEAMDGLARFVVKRMKEELATQVFEKVQDELGTANFEEFRALLPKTTFYLRNVNPDQYPRLLNSLRETVYEDINDLQVNLPKAVSTSARLAAFVAANPDYQFILEGLNLISQIKTVQHPLEILLLIENSSYVNGWASNSGNVDLHNFANAIKLSSLFVNSILVRESGNLSVIALDAWKGHANDLDFYKLYFGLISQQNILYYDVAFIVNGTTETLDSILGRFARNPQFNFDTLHVRFGKPIENLLYQAESVTNQLNEIRRMRRERTKIGSDTIVASINTAIDLIETSGKVANKLMLVINGNTNLANFNTRFNSFIFYSREATAIYQYASDKAYIQAIMRSWQSLNRVAGIAITNDTYQKVTRITDFLVTTSKAQNADDFAVAIDNFVLPAGSSSIKRKSKFDVSLNLYAGAFASREKLTDIKSDKPDTLWASNLALSVPIGIAASFGTGKNFGWKRDGAFTIFASVIDVGAITSFRFKDEASPLPKLEFKNVFAPGLHLMYGWPKTPFTIGFAAQYGPLLREVTMIEDNAPKIKEITSYRFGLTLTFDLPLLNIYTNEQ